MGSIDSDAHVIETMTTFDYIEPEYRHLRPRVVRQVEGEHVQSNEGGAQKEFWIIDGRLQPRSIMSAPIPPMFRARCATCARGSITWTRSISTCRCFIRRSSCAPGRRIRRSKSS